MAADAEVVDIANEPIISGNAADKAQMVRTILVRALLVRGMRRPSPNKGSRKRTGDSDITITPTVAACRVS